MECNTYKLQTFAQAIWPKKDIARTCYIKKSTVCLHSFASPIQKIKEEEKQFSTAKQISRNIDLGNVRCADIWYCDTYCKQSESCVMPSFGHMARASENNQEIKNSQNIKVIIQLEKDFSPIVACVHVIALPLIITFIHTMNNILKLIFYYHFSH